MSETRNLKLWEMNHGYFSPPRLQREQRIAKLRRERIEREERIRRISYPVEPRSARPQTIPEVSQDLLKDTFSSRVKSRNALARSVRPNQGAYSSPHRSTYNASPSRLRSRYASDDVYSRSLHDEERRLHLPRNAVSIAPRASSLLDDGYFVDRHYSARSEGYNSYTRDRELSPHRLNLAYDYFGERRTERLPESPIRSRPSPPHSPVRSTYGSGLQTVHHHQVTRRPSMASFGPVRTNRTQQLRERRLIHGDSHRQWH